MNNLKLYEEWFWKEKLTDIEKVQNEPLITIEELDKNLKLFQQYKDKVNFYMDAWRTHNKNEIYLDKSFRYFHHAVKLFYKLSKVKDILPEGFLKKNFEGTAKYFCDAQMLDNKINREFLEMFFDVCFYLNRINDDCFNGSNKRFYSVKNNNTYYFKDRVEEDRLREKHKDIDPLGEENWDEN